MSKIKIDWSKAEGGKFLKQAGEYIVKLTGYELDESDEGQEYIRWACKVTQGSESGATAKFVTSLSFKALWKLEDLLNAVKYPITRDSVQNLDLDDVIKKSVPFAIEFAEGRERNDGKGYYLQAEDFMSLDDYEQYPTKSEQADEGKPGNDWQDNEVHEEKDRMSELEDLIEEYDLDIDLEDYDTYEEAERAIKKAISKLEKVEDKRPTVYTEEMIEALKGSELDKLAEQIGLELDEDASPRAKRRSLIKALKANDQMEK